MGRVATDRAEIENAVMLAALSFQTEFMMSTYSRVQVHLFDELVEVILTRSSSVPAEDELAKSLEGRTLLRQFYRATFDSCQNLLQQRIEDAVGVRIRSLMADFDPATGKNTLIIRLHEPLPASTLSQSIS